MNIHRALQINTAALAAIGAVFLSLGHVSVFVPLLLAAAAVAAIALTDVLKLFQLNRIVANIIALAAVFWSLKNFFRHESDGQLLAIANMLVYLQIVLLFQEKSARVYWQLLVLSLLQVVVAAALSLGSHFAFLLGVYILLALSTLILLCVFRDLRRPAGAAPKPVAAAPAWRRLLASPEVAPGGLEAVAASAAVSFSTVIRMVLAIAGGTLLFTAVFFFATPRLTEGSWLGGTKTGKLLAGAPPHVRLPEQGHVQLSRQVVLRASFSVPRGREPLSLAGEPYFHGFVLNRYLRDERGSRWYFEMPDGPAPDRLRNYFPPPTVRQDIVLEDLDAPAIYAVLPVQSWPRELRYDRREYRIQRKLARDGSEGVVHGSDYRYTLGTLGIRSSRQLRAIPLLYGVTTLDEAEHLAEELRLASEFDREHFPRLAKVAAAALRDAGVADGPALEKIHALERHFHTFELYRYSLDLDGPRDPSLDPLEDFVANHRTGHCEYFASALVMMLRSQGIPARLVVGYRGGEFNSLGRYYVVRQKHAHAWVEAYLPVGEVEEIELAGPPTAAGVWYRLDPTPSSREGLAGDDEESLGRRIAQTFDYVELLWRDYVLGLSADRQQNSVFDPLTSHASSLPWLEPRRLNRLLRNWSEQLGIPLPRARGPAAQGAWQSALGVTIFFVAMAGFLGIRLSEQIAPRLRRMFSRQRAEKTIAPQAPAFYVQLEKLLAGLPLPRGASQTPGELALAAEQRLQTRANGEDAAHIPAQIVDAYYRVRFGGARLDKNETEQIEHALTSLQTAVSQAQKR